MARIKRPKFKAVTVSEFWKLVDGGLEPPRYCFLIMKDGSQNWGYPMNYTPDKPYGNKGGFFDHHRQGGIHRQDDIEFVLIPV